MANTLYSFNGGNPAEQNQTIAPGIAPAGVTPPTELADTVVVTSSGGTGSITGFKISSAGGADTVTLNGSPNLTTVDLGTGADILNIATTILGGSITSSSFAGASGNDTFNLIANGVGAAASFFGGGAGGDLFAMQGNFDNVTVAGGADRDRVLFTAAGGKATNSLFQLGAGDDIMSDQFFAVNLRGSTVEGGGDNDNINFEASSVGTGVQGLSIGGGFGNDTIIGTLAGQNTVLGGGNNDFIQTFADNDVIGGGAGADTIFAGTGADSVLGGGEADIIFGQAGQNTLSGGFGRDIIVGGANEDEIYAVSDNVEENDEANDTMIGGAGNDTVDGSSGRNWIFGDGVEGLAGLFNPFTAGINWTVNGAPPAGFKAAEFTASYTIDAGKATNITVNALAFASFCANPSLGDGFTSSLNYWFDLNPDINPAAFLAGTQTPTLAQLKQLADIDNLLVKNTPGINPANGKFANTALGDDSLVGDSGNDVIFGGRSGGANFAIDRDVIFGDNADPLDGNGGNDVIVGGTGADTMSGGIGNDLYLQGFGDSNTVANVTIGDNLTITFTGVGQPDRVDVITDFKAADSNGTIVDRISFQGWNGVLQNNLGTATGAFGGGNRVVIYSGIYDVVNGTFVTTDNKQGPDVLAFRSNGNLITAGNFDGQAVVLLGASDESITLGNFV